MSLGRTSTIYRLYDVAAVQDWFGHQEANILWEIAGFYNNDKSIKRELNAAYTKFCERFFLSCNNTYNSDWFENWYCTDLIGGSSSYLIG